MTPLRVGGRRAVIWRLSKRIASPQLQAKMGGDIKIPQLFDEKLWAFKAPQDDCAVMPTYSDKEWTAIAKNWLNDFNYCQSRVNNEKFNRQIKWVDPWKKHFKDDVILRPKKSRG